MDEREGVGLVVSVVCPRGRRTGGVVSDDHAEVVVVGVLHDHVGYYRWQPLAEVDPRAEAGDLLATVPTTPFVWLCRTVQLGVDTWSAIPPADTTDDPRRLAQHVRRWEASGAYVAPGSESTRLRLARIVGFAGAVALHDRDGLA